MLFFLLGLIPKGVAAYFYFAALEAGGHDGTASPGTCRCTHVACPSTFLVGAHILGEESLNLRGELVLVPQARTGAAHGLLRDRRLRL